MARSMWPAYAAGSPLRSGRADSFACATPANPPTCPWTSSSKRPAWNCAFQTRSTAALTNFTAERWNYFYSGNYYSAEYSVTHPKEPKHDTLAIQSAHLSADARTLTLNIADMRKSQQLQINLKLRTANGKPIERVIYLTVPVLAKP